MAHIDGQNNIRPAMQSSYTPPRSASSSSSVVSYPPHVTPSSSPWSSPANQRMSPKSPPVMLRTATLPAMPYSPRGHSRSGSSSGYDTASNLLRSSSSQSTATRKVSAGSETLSLSKQFDLKRMMSKPPLASSSTSSSHAKPDAFRLPQSYHTKCNYPLPMSAGETVGPSLQAFSSAPLTASTSEKNRRTTAPATANETSRSTRPSPMDSRSRSLLRKHRHQGHARLPHSLPNSPMSSSSFCETRTPSMQPSRKIIPLTPAAELAEAYRESERRRTRVAQEAAAANHIPVSDPIKQRQANQDQSLQTKVGPQPGTETVLARSLSRKASLKFSLKDWRISSRVVDERNPQADPQSRATCKPAMPQRADMTGLEPLEPLEPPIHSHRPRHNKHRRSASEDADLPQGVRLMKLVRKMSSSMLRGKKVELRHSPSPNSRSRQGQEASSRSEVRQTTVNFIGSKESPMISSSPSWYESRGETFLVKRPLKRATSTPSFRDGEQKNTLPNIDTIASPEGRPLLKHDVDLTPGECFEESLSTPMPKFVSEPPPVVKPVRPESPAIPVFSTQSTVNRFTTEEKAYPQGKIDLARAITNASVRSKQGHLQASRGLSSPSLLRKPRPQTSVGNKCVGNQSLLESFAGALGLPRKSEDILDVSYKTAPNGQKLPSGQRIRRTKSLDKITFEAHASFRELRTPHRGLTEEEKLKRWDELLERSDLAGGPIRATVTPSSLLPETVY